MRKIDLIEKVIDRIKINPDEEFLKNILNNLTITKLEKLLQKENITKITDKDNFIKIKPDEFDEYF